MYSVSLKQAFACAYCMGVSAIFALGFSAFRSAIDCPDHFLLPINLVLTLCGVWILKDAHKKGRNLLVGLTWCSIFVGFLLAMTVPDSMGVKGIYLVAGFLAAGLSTVFLRLGVTTASNWMLGVIHGLIWSLVFFKFSGAQWLSIDLFLFLASCWLISYHVWRFAPRLERLSAWEFASKLYLGIPNTFIHLILRKG